MPELPEVENIKRGLAKELIGQTFLFIKSDNKNHLNYPVKRYNNIIQEKKIISIKRIGKSICFKLSSNLYISIHLKMTGQLLFYNKIENSKQIIYPNKHTHVIFNFKSGDVLYFNDIRKFGYAKLFTQKEFKKYLENKKLGIEPFSFNFNFKYLYKKLKRSPNKNIKIFLTDQSVILGIGNIYADEILYQAKIKPARKTSSIKINEIKDVIKYTKKILTEAIKMGGSSISDYVNIKGVKGDYVKKHLVYGRGGSKCFKCKKILKKIKIAGRSTVYCDKCQK